MFTFVNIRKSAYRQRSGKFKHCLESFYREPVYETVSLNDTPEAERLKFKETSQKWLQRALDDPITKILLKTSNLTKTQLETLLIDILAENCLGKSLNYDEKGRLRLTKIAVSRGSFNRTLRQAKNNVTESIYTILLLGYLGIIQSTSLTPYLEAANKLQTYTNAYKELSDQEKDAGVQLKIVNVIREELSTMLEQLAKPRTTMDS
jgi:hypothetical protein